MGQADGGQQRRNFSLATVILARGLEWYQTQGKNGSVGVKFVGLSGDVVKPGIFEVPMGVTDVGADFRVRRRHPQRKEVAGFAPSGPSSGYFPA